MLDMDFSLMMIITENPDTTLFVTYAAIVS